MKGTLKRWAFGVVAAVLVLTVGAASAQGLWYKEVEKDGRIYVFNSAKRYDSWSKSGDMGMAITILGHGPNGETVIAENETAIDLYNLKHDRPGYNRPAPPPPPPPPRRPASGSGQRRALVRRPVSGLVRRRHVARGIRTDWLGNTTG